MAINVNDYSRTAAQRGWGSGWPSCAGAKAAGTAVVAAAHSGTRVSVHKRIARLAALLIDETERRGYLLRPGQCGGYNCRAIAGTTVSSNHAWGLAIDINWQSNPYVIPRITDMPAWMPLLWNRYGFAWGGNYNDNGRLGKADSMHYEFMGTPTDADQMTALALTGVSAPPRIASPATTLEDDLMASIPIIPDVGGRFHHAVGAEAGGGSQVASSGWIGFGSTYGGTTFTVAALGADGKVLAYWPNVRCTNNTAASRPLPDGTRAVTAEGQADNAGTRPWASVYCLR